MTWSETAMWRAPEERDLKISISETEVEGFRGAATADVTVDTVASMLARTASLVRGYCRANPKVRMGPPGTIPEGLMAAAMDYMAVDVVKRTPAGVTEERRRAREAAIRLFERVAEGKHLVESYGMEDDASGGSAVEVAASSPARFTPEELARL